VDLEFPDGAPPHAFRENDRIVWLGSLTAYGRNVLDGHFALYRAADRRIRHWGVPDETSRERFLEAGIPVFRLSNIFIAQEAGPDRLRVAHPANADFERISERETPPEGLDRNQEARRTGRFFDPPIGARPVPSAAVSFERAIDPDRDLNAAGLVYFANFTTFFHAAERRALAGLRDGGPSRPSVDRRVTRRRRLGFFGNARADDQLRIRAECAIVPEPVLADVPPRSYGLMWFTASIERASDGHLVAISTAERIAPLAHDDVSRWRAYAASLV
jgi:probable biosynthetic protein (TIGR04098 family)